MQIRAGNQKRKAWKSGSRAHINHFCAFSRRKKGEQGEAVDEMFGDYSIRLLNCREVYFLIPFKEQGGIGVKTG